ncbi:MAG: S8 family serine peptidase, partial [Methylobacteriaceae bacterium]|nr:S8 family serine peptidase [Methylobacteriaceae bacterium]
ASPPLYPAADPDVIAVTATNRDDSLYALANRGRFICIAAPGVDIVLAAPDGQYDILSGTSLSAAYVSGIAALLLERRGDLDETTIRAILVATAKRLGSAPDDRFGAGLTDALAAVSALQSLPQPAAPPQAASMIH